MNSSNVVLGVHVLEDLLFADADELCDIEPSQDTDEVFVPIWSGPTTGSGIGVLLQDADDLDNGRFNRVCEAPDPAAGCYPSTRDIPP